MLSGSLDLEIRMPTRDFIRLRAPHDEAKGMQRLCLWIGLLEDAILWLGADRIYFQR